MRIEMYHASKFGNGAMVAAELKKVMESKGAVIDVHHVDDASPKEIPPADLYVFSSPGRFGKPIKEMRKFLKKLQLPAGSRYVLLATEMNPAANGTSVTAPTEGELGACQMVIPMMEETLREKGLLKVAEGKVFVTGIKGPLEDRWRAKVEELSATLLRLS